MVQPHKSTTDENNNKEEADVGALIYRESQLRKAEAEAVADAAKRDETLTRERTQVVRRENASTVSHQRGRDRLWKERRTKIQRMFGEAEGVERPSIDTNAQKMDARTKSSREECVEGMGQRHYVAKEDAQITLRKEECVGGTVQRQYAATKDAQIMPSKEECV